jgi:hypothetical protein
MAALVATWLMATGCSMIDRLTGNDLARASHPMDRFGQIARDLGHERLARLRRRTSEVDPPCLRSMGEMGTGHASMQVRVVHRVEPLTNQGSGGIVEEFERLQSWMLGTRPFDRLRC